MPADDDAPADVQPETGALADRLGREERLEDPRLDVGRNAGPGITDVDQKLLALDCGPDGQRAVPGHSSDCVVDQVGPYLVELAGEARNRRQVRAVVPNDTDLVADLSAEHGERAVQQLVHVGRLIRCTVQLRVLLSGT